MLLLYSFFKQHLAASDDYAWGWVGQTDYECPTEWDVPQECCDNTDALLAKHDFDNFCFGEVEEAILEQCGIYGVGEGVLDTQCEIDLNDLSCDHEGIRKTCMKKNLRRGGKGGSFALAEYSLSYQVDGTWHFITIYNVPICLAKSCRTFDDKYWYMDWTVTQLTEHYRNDDLFNGLDVSAGYGLPCADRDLAWKGDPRKDCSWVARKPETRCNRSQDGKLLSDRDYCPATCRTGNCDVDF